mgnify:CR=1 FL=1
MSKFIQRLGTASTKFAVEIHLTKVEISLLQQCRVSVTFKRGMWIVLLFSFLPFALDFTMTLSSIALWLYQGGCCCLRGWVSQSKKRKFDDNDDRESWFFKQTCFFHILKNHRQTVFWEYYWKEEGLNINERVINKVQSQVLKNFFHIFHR